MECPLFNTVTFHDRNLHQALKTERESQDIQKRYVVLLPEGLNEALCELPIQDPSLTRRGDQLIVLDYKFKGKAPEVFLCTKCA